MKNNTMILSKKERGLRDTSYVTLLSDIIDAETSSYEEVAKKKEKECTSSRRMMSRMQFHHAVDGNIVGYKVRFIARGFSRKEGINYEETFVATRN